MSADTNINKRPTKPGMSRRQFLQLASLLPISEFVAACKSLLPPMPEMPETLEGYLIEPYPEDHKITAGPDRIVFIAGTPQDPDSPTTAKLVGFYPFPQETEFMMNPMYENGSAIPPDVTGQWEVFIFPVSPEQRDELGDDELVNRAGNTVIQQIIEQRLCNGQACETMTEPEMFKPESSEPPNETGFIKINSRATQLLPQEYYYKFNS